MPASASSTAAPCQLPTLPGTATDLSCTCLPSPAAPAGDGEKDKTGFNACEYGDLGSHWEKWYAAMPAGCGSQGWESNKCGKCIKARGLDAGAPGGWVVVKVVDQCASCTCGDVDFSTRGLQAVTGFSWDRKKVEW